MFTSIDNFSRLKRLHNSRNKLKTTPNKRITFFSSRTNETFPAAQLRINEIAEYFEITFIIIYPNYWKLIFASFFCRIRHMLCLKGCSHFRLNKVVNYNLNFDNCMCINSMIL